MENVEERILDIRVRYDDAISNIAKYRTQLDVLEKRTNFKGGFESRAY